MLQHPSFSNLTLIPCSQTTNLKSTASGKCRLQQSCMMSKTIKYWDTTHVSTETALTSKSRHASFGNQVYLDALTRRWKVAKVWWFHPTVEEICKFYEPKVGTTLHFLFALEEKVNCLNKLIIGWIHSISDSNVLTCLPLSCVWRHFCINTMPQDSSIFQWIMVARVTEQFGALLDIDWVIDQ